MKLLLALALPVCLLLSSCAGYHLGGQKPAHLRSIETLAVPAFQNLTLEPRVAVNTTNAVIKQIQNHGSYRLVSRDKADAVLIGTIRNVSRGQYRSDRSNILRTSQMLITLEVTYELQDRHGRVLHTHTAIGESFIFRDPNMQLSETQALEDAAQRLAINLANELCEGW